jgi:dienelactone hydrolase
LAERLASHGFAVVAPDHTGNTLMEAEAGVTAPLTSAFLQVRGRDIRFVLDAVLAQDAAVLPKPLQGRLDASRVGAMGHSFGSVTTGLMAQDDPRIDAAFCLAAPIDNPLLAGVSAAKVKVPIAFVLAQEDNSITEAGNLFLRQNYANVAGPAWLIELVDAGHWSFTDIAGLIDAFDPGCGEGLRMGDSVTPFAYVDPVVSRAMVARHAAAFFALHLRGEGSAKGTLELADPAALETVQSRP